MLSPSSQGFIAVISGFSMKVNNKEVEKQPLFYMWNLSKLRPVHICVWLLDANYWIGYQVLILKKSQCSAWKIGKSAAQDPSSHLEAIRSSGRARPPWMGPVPPKSPHSGKAHYLSHLIHYTLSYKLASAGLGVCDPIHPKPGNHLDLENKILFIINAIQLQSRVVSEYKSSFFFYENKSYYNKQDKFKASIL